MSLPLQIRDTILGSFAMVTAKTRELMSGGRTLVDHHAGMAV
jgi:hypothetical protein